MEEYEQLKAGIANVLDDIFMKLSQEDQSSVEVLNGSEPLKANNSKETTKKFKSSQKEVSEGKKVEV